MKQKDLSSNRIDTNEIINKLFKQIGIVPSYKKRKKIAKYFGIQNYIGTTDQNIELIQKLESYR